MPRLRSMFLGLVAVAGLVPAARADFYLKDGDRVVFYGDSITDQRLYTTFVETYTVTRFPRREIGFVHSGWGGDRVTGGGGGPIGIRLARDVFAYRPTVVTVMLGMNDASYRPFDEKVFETYSKGYEHLVKEVKSALPGVRMTLIQPSPFDDVTRKPAFEGGYNAVLIRYGEFVKELAKRENVDVADLNTSVVEALKKANQSDPDTAKKLIPDRIHPMHGGQLLMAAALLKAWDAPALVSEVEIDAEGGRVLRAENARVEGVRSRADLTWTQTDEALPFPIDMNDSAVALAVRSSEIVRDLNRQGLRVTGLSDGDYSLSIDGREVGTFSRRQLDEGINLAGRDTPMARQAAGVHALTRKHNDLHFARWRNVQVPLQTEVSPNIARALADLDAAEAEIVQRQRAAAQPRPRQFELSRK